MRLALRWLGADDPIPLSYIAQIPDVAAAVWSLPAIPAGRLWPAEAIEANVARIRAVGLGADVVESLPVHEDIKLGRATRDEYLSVYKENLTRLGRAGISLVVYNFMPLFDWFRTDLAMELGDGSTALAYSDDELDASADPWEEGWAAYSPLDGTPDSLRESYRELDEAKLRENLLYFLESVVPAAERAGVNLGIHPDDPPWSIFGIPRIVKNRDDLAMILEAVDTPTNGLTLCVGSLGADPSNDPVALVRQFAGRIHFVHGRNVKHTGPGQFHETPHPPGHGDVDLVAVLSVLHEIGYTGWIRPDHGRMIWGETGTPGYGLYDRALGAAFLNGVWQATRRAER